MTTIPLAIPVVSVDKNTAKIEELFLRRKMSFDHMRLELDDDDDDDRTVVLANQRKLDNLLLGCVSKALQASKPGRALDFATMLTLPGSFDLAVKLAVKQKLPMLAERMSFAKAAFLEDSGEAPLRPRRAVPRHSQLEEFEPPTRSGVH